MLSPACLLGLKIEYTYVAYSMSCAVLVNSKRNTLEILQCKFLPGRNQFHILLNVNLHICFRPGYFINDYLTSDQCVRGVDIWQLSEKCLSRLFMNISILTAIIMYVYGFFTIATHYCFITLRNCLILCTLYFHILQTYPRLLLYLPCCDFCWAIQSGQIQSFFIFYGNKKTHPLSAPSGVDACPYIYRV